MGQYLSFAAHSCNTLKNKTWSYWFLNSLTSKAPSSLLHETILCLVMKRTAVMVLKFFEQDVLLRNRTTGNSSSVSWPLALLWLAKCNWSVASAKKLYVNLQTAEGEMIILHHVSVWVSFTVEACEVEYHIINQMLHMWDLKCQCASSGIIWNKNTKSREQRKRISCL